MIVCDDVFFFCKRSDWLKLETDASNNFGLLNKFISQRSQPLP